MARPTLLFSSFLILLLIISASAHSGHHHDDSDSDSDSDSNSSSSVIKPNLRAKSLILVKVWCLILIFLATFIGGISPCLFTWNESFLVLGTQFAGGVFLGTAVMHFLSDAAETFEDLTDKEYPFAFMLACVGYLITMFADIVVMHVYKKRDDDGAKFNNGGLEGRKINNSTNTPNCDSNSQLTTATSIGDTILLILALCFHSIFEGIAIGVAETKGDAWKALWTISLHKIFAAIAMAIALLRMMPNRPIITCASYAFAFAISSPIGVAIGIIIDATAEGAVADWIFAISMGIACGVFVYVSINHLLSKGYVPHGQVEVNSPICKFCATLLGIGVIAVVMIWDT